MSIRVGSWRDPEVARDAKVAVAISVATLLIAIVPSGLVWVFLGPVALGTLAALLMASRGGARSSLGEARSDVPHRGYNISRIAVAGFPGLVLVGGFVWMFWSGLPIMRPVVVTAAIVGCLAGVSLIVLGRWRRAPEPNVLGLASCPASQEERR
jgi:hypothetical protein